MEIQQVKIEGIIKPNSINRMRKEWGIEGCSFYLESGVYVYCDKFIPNIRKNWIVRVYGYWGKGRDFIAENIEVIGKLKEPKPLLKGQLKLGEFVK